MEINEVVFYLFNLLLQVILWSLIISTPLIILTIEMYAYERYKRWKKSEDQEFERIIVGRAETKENLSKEIEKLTHEKRDLEIDVKLLNKEKTGLQKVLGVEEDPEQHDEPEQKDETQEPEVQKTPLEEKNIKQLQSLAREYNIKWYSRMKKKVLIEAIRPYYDTGVS